MNNGINIPAVIIANAMGFVMLSVLTLNNFWRLKEKTEENKYLHILLQVSFIACLLDPLAFLADGKPGFLCRLTVIIANAYLYEANMISSYAWNRFLTNHINAPKNKLKSRLMIGMCLIGILFLIINLFYPIVFEVDDNNVYSRSTLFWVYMVANAAIVMDSICVYLNTKKRGGLLKLFPLWVYLVPFVIGVIIQTIFYGVSTIWPFMSIAVMGVMACMKNETIFVDHLTGIYNRFYLDYLQKKISKSNKGDYSAMMLDLNDFKKINDTYGHSVGDDALVQTAQLLTEAIGSRGVVMRYAGDEFIILLNTIDNNIIERKVQKIRNLFAQFNETNQKEYELSVSIGYAKFDVKNQSIFELMNIIDKNMYEDKRAYYTEHNRRSEVDYKYF